MTETSDNLQRVSEIFEQAAKLSGTARAAYLREACLDDDVLRAEVESLLAARTEQGDFLAEPTHAETAAIDGATVRSAPRETVGHQIGRYKLLQVIGEGGFGAVYMAEQKEPVRRKVALKIIKLGMDTKQVIARFEAERQALAMMDHPNIAKVLDAGATEAGRPYFVMELVKGVPITEYCDTENLTTKQRLELFTSVCNAVQHAHQKGIIHRDLKPSNVMVTLHDGKPVPKVIDFGIAKAMNRDLTDKTLFTEYRQFLGTPEYMSPEQAEMSGLDIDTRSDIYSLGVLLYELLTGTTPFDPRKLRSAAMGEIQRIIREEEPHRPSTRLSTMGEALTGIAKHRREQPGGLVKALRGDLDWIVMKALEKERGRRYETANGLAMDVRRYLDDEAVVAGRPGAGYRLRKFVRRNRVGVTAGAAVAAALVLATVVGVVFGVQATRARDAANAARAELAVALEGERDARELAVANEARAVEEAARAERELARATEVKRIITEMLSSVSPEVALGADTTLLKSILDDTAARLAAGEITDKLIAAELHNIIGNTYWQLGLDSEAEKHLPRNIELIGEVYGPDDPRTLRMANETLWPLYCRMGRQRAEGLIRDTWTREREVFGPDDPDTMETQALLANVYTWRERYDEAEPLLLEALERQRRELGPEHPDTCQSIVYMGMLRSVTGKHEEGEALFVEGIDGQRRALGDVHPNVLLSQYYLGEHYLRAGATEQARDAFAQVLDGQRRVLGENHWRTRATVRKLADVEAACGRVDDAERLYEAEVEWARRQHGTGSAEELMAREHLGHFYGRHDRFEDAARHFEAILKQRRSASGSDDRATMRAIDLLLWVLEALGRHDEMEPLARELLEACTRTLGPDHPETILATNNLAWLLLTREPAATRRPAEALPMAEQARAAAEATGDPRLWVFLDTLALARHRTGDYAGALEAQRRAVALIPDGVEAGIVAEMNELLEQYEAAANAAEAP